MDRAVIEQLATGVLSPQGMSLVLLFFLWFKIPRVHGIADPALNHAASWRQLLAPLLVAGVVLLSWPIVFSLTFPPVDTFARMPWIWLGVALALMGVKNISHRHFRVLAVAAVVLIAAPFVVPSAQLKLISTQDLAIQAGLLVVCSFLSAGWIPEIAEKSPRSAAVIICISLTGACQVLILGFSSLKLGQAVGMLGAIAGAFMFLTIWKNRDLSGKGLDATFSAASILTLLAGVHSTDTVRPWLYIFLITATPLVSWLFYKIPLKSSRYRAVLAIVAASAMVAITLGIAFANRPVDEYQASIGRVSGHERHTLIPCVACFLQTPLTM